MGTLRIRLRTALSYILVRTISATSSSLKRSRMPFLPHPLRTSPPELLSCQHLVIVNPIFALVITISMMARTSLLLPMHNPRRATSIWLLRSIGVYTAWRYTQAALPETSLNRSTPQAQIDAVVSRSDVVFRMKNVEQGAATTVWAAVANELEGKGGKYLEDCQESMPWGGSTEPLSVRLDFGRIASEWFE